MSFDSYREASQPRSTPNETDSVAFQKSLEYAQISRKGDPNFKVFPTTFKMVVPGSQWP